MSGLTLHPEWKTILFKAWSMRLQGIVALFSAVDAGVTYAVDGRVGASALVFASSFATAVARIVKQASVSGPAGDADE